jgi:Tol biopolymer transport system component
MRSGIDNSTAAEERQMSKCLQICRAFVACAFFSASLLFVNASATADQARQNGPIIVIADPEGSWQLFSINADGTGLTQITHMPTTIFSGWAPHVFDHGTRIIFTYGDGSGPTDIYVIDINGTGLQRITYGGRASSGAPSPDGTRLVYDTYSSKTGRQPYLVTVALNDPDLKMAITSDLYLTSYGVYTPDGKRIVYSTSKEGVIDATWMMNASGSDKRPLTAPGPEFCPGTVSPNNQWLLLVKHCLGPQPSTIWALNLNNNTLQQLTHSSGSTFDGGPAYSPDGEKIAFFRAIFQNGSYTGMYLFTMNADGTRIREVALGLISGCTYNLGCLFPTWAPKK